MKEMRILSSLKSLRFAKSNFSSSLDHLKFVSQEFQSNLNTRITSSKGQDNDFALHANLEKDAFYEYDEKNVSKMKILDDMVKDYSARCKEGQGIAEFVELLLEKQDELELNRCLESYKVIFKAIPPHIFASKNMWQVKMNYFPKQQYTGHTILYKMYSNDLCADDDFRNLAHSRFGHMSTFVREINFHLYFKPKMKNIGDFALPVDMPKDSKYLALIALRKICRDSETEILLHSLKQDPNPSSPELCSGDKVNFPTEDMSCDEWIASAQSPQQKALLVQIVENNLKTSTRSKAFFIEGPYHVFLSQRYVWYYWLKAPLSEEDEILAEKVFSLDICDDCSEWTLFHEKEKTPLGIVDGINIHKQDDGYYLAFCVPNISNRDDPKNVERILRKWLQILQKSNPQLETAPAFINVKSDHYV